MKESSKGGRGLGVRVCVGLWLGDTALDKELSRAAVFRGLNIVPELLSSKDRQMFFVILGVIKADRFWIV